MQFAVNCSSLTDYDFSFHRLVKAAVCIVFVERYWCWYLLFTGYGNR